MDLRIQNDFFRIINNKQIFQSNGKKSCLIYKKNVGANFDENNSYS